MEEYQSLERVKSRGVGTHRGVHHATNIAPLRRDGLDRSLRLPQRLELLQTQHLDSILRSQLSQDILRGLSVVDNDLEGRAVIDDLDDHGKEISVGEDGSNRGLVDSVGESRRSEGIVGSTEGS